MLALAEHFGWERLPRWLSKAIRLNTEDNTVRREIPVEDGDANTEGPNPLAQFFSGGNILTMIVSLVMVAVAWGSLNRQTSENERRIISLENRDMTPGASAAISRIDVYDKALDQRVTNIESEMRSQRVEMMGYLQRIQDMIQDHANHKERP